MRIQDNREREREGIERKNTGAIARFLISLEHRVLDYSQHYPQSSIRSASLYFIITNVRSTNFIRKSHPSFPLKAS